MALDVAAGRDEELMDGVRPAWREDESLAGRRVGRGLHSSMVLDVYNPVIHGALLGFAERLRGQNGQGQQSQHRSAGQ
ncbi:hypothetical protein [Streptomyces sp. CdTB01]|uniref:hypothetical protein n=1 Tax=Streptomyces sp. CdTB01 TaxID=1725411 RepID=UPI00131EF8BA|nr:hypothetical protein [Streptomyces sp. CdTB01]